MLKGKVKGIYLRGEIYWFGKQIDGRRSIVSLETRDYAEAVQRAREIVERPELQPAQALMAEVERFLKNKYETNRFSKMSAESKVSILKMFAESVRNIPPTQVTTYQCKAFYSAAKGRVAPSTAESYMSTSRFCDDPKKIGLRLTVFVRVLADCAGPRNRRCFVEETREMPQVIECQLMAGGLRLLLRVMEADFETYRAFRWNTARASKVFGTSVPC